MPIGAFASTMVHRSYQVRRVAPSLVAKATAGSQTFLLEMMVVAQYLSNAKIRADDHRHAVRKAVPLVEPAAVEVEGANP